MRRATPDMLPIIGKLPGQEGVWCAFGHAYQGLTLGPTTGRLVRRGRLPLRLLRPPPGFRRLPFRFRGSRLGGLQLRRVRCGGFRREPLRFVQASLRRFGPPASLRRPGFRLARLLGRFLGFGLGHLPLRPDCRDRLRGGGLGLPDVFQPFRDTAHDSGDLGGTLVGGGGPLLCDPRSLACFLGGGLCSP